jgi:chitin disaccharide deacetylase
LPAVWFTPAEGEGLSLAAMPLSDNLRPMISTPRPLAICADDYAISPAVSLGIRQLAEAGRLTATGVMTCMPAWPAEAPSLSDLGERIAVGLHFTLTDQRPLGPLPELAPSGRFPSIGGLLKQSLAGRLPAAEVANELERQLDAFERHFGRPPDFIDGHQHVHLLPGVCEAVLAIFDRRLDRTACWLRDCTDRPAALWRRGQSVKAGFIAVLGRRLAKAAAARRIRTNRGFSGFYDAAREDLAAALPRMVQAPGEAHLLMVHPGHVDAELSACDSLTLPREAEWSFLIGPGLPEVLADRGLVLAGRDFPG